MGRAACNLYEDHVGVIQGFFILTKTNGKENGKQYGNALELGLFRVVCGEFRDRTLYATSPLTMPELGYNGQKSMFTVRAYLRYLILISCCALFLTSYTIP